MSDQGVNRDNINDIIKKCLKNDRKSQKLLFDTYAGRLMAVSYRYMGNEDEANEVLQEGFIKIFSKLHTYRPSSDDFNIFYWMKKVIVNTALDKLRQRKIKRKITLSDQDDVFKTIDHDEIFDFELPERDKKTAEILMNAIAKLSPMYKMVFNMYVIEDYSHIEIANKLGISEGTSKSNLFKAKANLKKALKNKIEFLY